MNEGGNSVLEGAEASGGEVVKKDGGIRSSVEENCVALASGVYHCEQEHV
jgi:hypothetical protein